MGAGGCGRPEGLPEKRRYSGGRYPSPGPVTFPIRSQEPDLEAGGALHRAAMDGIRLSEVLCYTLDPTVVLLRLQDLCKVEPTVNN